MPKGFREKSAQYRAVVKNRRSMRARGLSRFEVRGLAGDKELVRSLAKRLAQADPEAQRLRTELVKAVASEGEGRGGVWRWLRASPLVGSGIDLEREFVHPRKIDL